MRKRRRTVFDDGWFMRALSSISYGVSGMARREVDWTFAGSAAGLSEWRKREIARIPRGRSELIFDSQICNSSKMFLRLRRPKPDIDGTEIPRCSDLVCAIVWAQQRGRQHLFPTEREEFHHAFRDGRA